MRAYFFVPGFIKQIMQLVRIVGRSDLAGRPFLYGTTHLFLEHFGLRNLDELGKLHPSLGRDKVGRKAKKEDERPPEADESEESDEEDKQDAGSAESDGGPAEDETPS